MEGCSGWGGEWWRPGPHWPRRGGRGVLAWARRPETRSQTDPQRELLGWRTVRAGTRWGSRGPGRRGMTTAVQRGLAGTLAMAAIAPSPTSPAMAATDPSPTLPGMAVARLEPELACHGRYSPRSRRRRSGSSGARLPWPRAQRREGEGDGVRRCRSESSWSAQIEGIGRTRI